MEYPEDIGCNNATSALINNFSGNIIPNFWYKKIVTKSGRPDLSAITILAEIIYWYRPGKDGKKKFKDDAWQTSYEYFENKFGHNRQKIRRTLVKLEELNIIKRDIRNIRHYGQKYGNVLFILLKDYSLLGYKDLDKEKIKDKKISFSKIKNDTPLLQNCRDYIDIENKKENSRSNFSNRKRFYLKEFYPISEADLEILQKESGRNFNLNSSNEILLNLAKKLPKHQFPDKKTFLKYMAKALKSEMRQSEQINNASFKISANKHKEEKIFEEEEKFIDNIENSSSVSSDIRLKRRIIGLFERSKALEIIKSIKILEGKIIFEKIIELSPQDKEIILREAVLIFGEGQVKIEYRGQVESESEQKKAKEINIPIIWQKVRKEASDILGKDIDKSWFSRLLPEFDYEERIIKLKADTEFIRDWVNNNYKDFLIHVLYNNGYRLKEVY